jgi:hypothetical protein
MSLALAQLALAGPTPDAAPDDFGSPFLLFFVLALLFALAAATFIVAALVSGTLLAMVGAACVALLILGSLAAAAASFNFALATLVWTRRPAIRRWMGTRGWGTLTLLAGPFAAVPFWWLHYQHRIAPAARLAAP